MLATQVTKFAFRIKTRVGLIVDNLMIHGRDEEDAVRKLRQIYRDCEIIECVCHEGVQRAAPTSYEEIISLITG